MGMNRVAAAFLLLAFAAPRPAAAGALSTLLETPGAENPSAPGEVPPPQLSGVDLEAEQYLPPNNAEPGFEWPDQQKASENFIYIGNAATFLKSGTGQAAGLQDGAGKCQLAANTLYKAAAKPGFTGEHMTVQLADPLPGCQLTSGYVFLTHVSSSSAGGAWELPRTVRAFLDTLAFAEGTRDNYNYIFTFVTFDSYADHPRRKICSGGLCSTAAGRYQFLSKTWDPLAADLGLTDFTPPNQEKATLEIIRRAGAYNLVLKSGVQANFNAALAKLNTTWASLPGSPYGQPTHPASELWKYYRGQLAKY